VACLAVPHFLINGTVFGGGGGGLHRQNGFFTKGGLWGGGGGVPERKMCVLISTATLSEIFLIIRTERDIIINAYWSSC